MQLLRDLPIFSVPARRFAERATIDPVEVRLTLISHRQRDLADRHVRTANQTLGTPQPVSERRLMTSIENLA